MTVSLPATIDDRGAAERRAERIRLRLDAIADNVDAVLPMIREAIEKGDHAALGYRSVGEYVQDRFGGALNRLPRDLRRPVVHELASAGMSTRAIAPVVGYDRETVAADLRGGRNLPPADDILPDVVAGEEVTPAMPTPRGDAGPGGAAVTPPTVERVEPPTPRSTVTGIDGKTYTRPAPAPRRGPLTDSFWKAAFDLGRRIDSVRRLTDDDRFPQNAERVAAAHRNDLIRYRDLLQEVIDRLPTA